MRALFVLPAVIVAFFAVHLPWTHAALANTWAGERCEVAGARDRVKALFGTMRSRPVVRCLPGPALGLRISHGATHFAFGLPAIVTLGPEGRNVDVAAHELAHAELAHAEFAHRAGLLAKLLRMPVWFDEGLAMQVDARTAYDRKALARMLADPSLSRPSLARLTDRAGFYAAGRQGRFHYAFAACVVGEWRAAQGSLALFDWTPPRSTRLRSSRPPAGA